MRLCLITVCHKYVSDLTEVLCSHIHTHTQTLGKCMFILSVFMQMWICKEQKYSLKTGCNCFDILLDCVFFLDYLCTYCKSGLDWKWNRTACGWNKRGKNFSFSSGKLTFQLLNLATLSGLWIQCEESVQGLLGGWNVSYFTTTKLNPSATFRHLFINRYKHQGKGDIIYSFIMCVLILSQITLSIIF